MANEATLQISLQIKKNSLEYQCRPTSYKADVSGQKGPVPGAFTVTTYGTDLDLAELTTPGLCRIQNLDETNYVEWGIYDPVTDAFYPLGEILATESYVIRFSRNVQEQYEGTGTGTTTPTKRVRFKANTANVNVLVEAFEA